MRHVLSSWRKRATLLTVAGLAVLAAAVTTLVMLNSGPAAATWQSLSGEATCDCVVKNDKTGQYRAVFGYANNSRQSGKIAAGENNRLEVTGLNAPPSSKVDGAQTTTFEPGQHKAAFATGWVSKDVQVTWSVGGKRAAANWSKPTCGRDVSLPATGNGSGPLIALLGSLLIAGAAIVVRKRRIASRAL